MASDSPCGDGITQQKHELRAQVIARRDAMDPVVRACKSSTIYSELASAIEASLSTYMERRPTVAAYSPMGSEVNMIFGGNVAHVFSKETEKNLEW